MTESWCYLSPTSSPPIQVVLRYIWCYLRLSSHYLSPATVSSLRTLFVTTSPYCANLFADKGILLKLLQPQPVITFEINTVIANHKSQITITTSLSVIHHGWPPWSSDQLHKSLPGDKPGKRLTKKIILLCILIILEIVLSQF